ncbi:MAG: adenylosuccinate lyase [Deltaproteobacteria bacterium]|nr:adenylosuccinate lyase [Deltaproteobacteria bacterium]MBT4268687.1 adenylosuccinate lyase [Deltaproteobacteria bacterium]MBT4642320.1 adenylosuccinate lyase [Deltaproteobacteria bacterium]MBT6503264.1 adenylosuccinate lyase [Deltaproteobacteria bacterium]MBT7155812.1 adenylosuccinate lyase [Deltaproteobacteria bacterium]
MDKLSSVQAISPLDGRYSSKVEELQQYCSEYALIKYRIQVEIEWLIALAAHPGIDCISPFNQETLSRLRQIYEDFSPQEAVKIKEIERITNHDVKAVEYFINEKLAEFNLSSLSSMVHFACTSEDINNLSYGLFLRHTLKDVVLPACESVLTAIREKAEAYRQIPMIARTHGQPATPTTMGKEFYNVAERMQRQLLQMQHQEILGKINGAVGNFNAHLVSYPEIDWRKFSRDFVESLGLSWNPATTQIEPHDYMAEIFHQFVRWNNILLDFDRDIWSYISIDAFKQIPVQGQVGSSTMPHKINPIDFENSEGNLGIANALFEHLGAKLPVSRWQRDLTDSTVLRNIGVGFGYSILAYKATLNGLSKLAINEEKMAEELKASWLILGEALQTVMRRYQIPEPYEKLKALTRGKAVDQKVLQDFIDSLELPEDVKESLRELTPQVYLGYAKDF